MDTNERQIALAVLESLRGDLPYAHLKGGSPVLVGDFREYVYEISSIRMNAPEGVDMYGQQALAAFDQPRTGLIYASAGS